MTELSPRLQAIFNETKTVCFGRFLIDVPEATSIAWGQAETGFGDIDVYDDGTTTIYRMADEKVAALSSEKAINHDHAPLLLSDSRVSHPEGRLVIGYTDFEALDDYALSGYFSFPPFGVHVKTRSIGDALKPDTDALLAGARKLRLRADDEIPAEPGICLEHLFLKGPPADNVGDGGVPYEHVRIGFRLKAFPDVHLSIYVAPANPYDPGSDSLKKSLLETQRDAAKAGVINPLDLFHTLREGERQIHDWTTGYEILTRTPEVSESHAHHSFVLKFTGVPRDALRPYVDIELESGVGENAVGAVEPSLTDKEAVALWDKLTSSLRVRPAQEANPSSGADRGS